MRLARRAKIVLLAAQGKENIEIASALGVGRVQVGRCRERYAKQGFAGIERDLPRGGRKRVIETEEIVQGDDADAAQSSHALEFAQAR